MRTADVDYDLPASIPGDPQTSLCVSWEIEFETYRKGPDASIWIKARALTVMATIGGEPFLRINVREKPADALRDWLRARAMDLTFEAIGYTEAEAKREYSEEQADLEEESRQIGRPL